MRGKISRIKADKGFGFIAGDDDIKYFMHFSACDKTTFSELVARFGRGEESIVEFTPTESDRGPRAEDVSIYG